MATSTPTYTFTAINRAGKKVTGKIGAGSEQAAAQRVKQMGFTVTEIKAGGTGLNAEIPMPGQDKVTLKDLAVMSRQFATMINSGLSLLRALHILSEQSESRGLHKALTEVRDAVESGASLSNALAQNPKVFPPIMINMIRAGEVGGFLDKVLLQLADNFEKEVALKNKVKSAMTYPVVVFIMAIIAVIGMLIFIVPVFQGMFDGLGAELPLPTKILVVLSNVMKFAAPLMVVAVIAIGVMWGKIKNSRRTHEIVDPIMLKMPIFGDLFRKVAISRFARNFGTMLSSGVPILQCLSIVGETAGNVVIAEAISDVQEAVSRGEAMAGPLAAYSVFPPMMVQMLAVGEDTGAMDEMLHKLSDFYDQEVEATTEALASLIEPLMIAVLGAIVGSMIIALYMPIFTVFEAIQNQ